MGIATKGLSETTDAEIEAALAHASLPALMMSMIHMSGETSLLDGPVRPRHALMFDMDAGIASGDAAAIRRRAATIVRDYVDRGAPPPSPLPRETVERMMSVALADEAISEDARGFLLEELALGGADPRRLDIDTRALARRGESFHVVVIGAGMSGLLLGHRLAQQGVPFTILEKNDAVGGTWHENRYPGCRVDIASYSYSYSFEQGAWQHFFGPRAEVQDYFEGVAEREKLRERIRFGATVEEARWDEASRRWIVAYAQDGRRQEIEAAVLVSAIGLLNRPKIPAIPGREDFRGVQMHTARWDESVDLRGKRVAVVGTGASAFQLVPALADTTERTFVFQRRPSWMFPNPEYHAAITDEHQWCLRNLPEYARWFRIVSMWPQFDKAAGDLIMVDPDWDDGGASCSQANRVMRDELTAWITSQIDDPELLARVVPDYPPFGTRMLQDDGTWLATLSREDVELVPHGVVRLTETGVVAADGVEYAVDAVLWATGFETGRLPAIDLVGRGGTRLSEAWGDEPKGHLGITVPGFPNFFSIVGPNTGVLHSGNLIIVSECQVNYILDAIRLLVEELDELDCRSDVTEAYHARLSSELERSIFARVPSYFSNAAGKVVVCMPWKLAEYWRWTRRVDPKDFRTTRGTD
ncbi:MAG TPA: NAD(P)/FAD-dependent oxidoreductase [Myxococcota bacterium]|nr:NAD(P)/FAD-dependent oxidoreductase [Myxococcota bacterium]